MDELHDQELQLLGVSPQGLVGGLHPQDIAVVICPPDIDLALEAPLALVLVVGNVGGEVGVLPVGTDQDPILVIAELGSAQPQGTLLLIGAPLLGEDRQGVSDGTRIPFVQGALEEPVVEGLHPEACEGGLDRLHHQPHGPLTELLDVERGCVGDLGGKLGDVIPLVAPLGELLSTGEGLDGLPELAHLGTGIVDVELPRDDVAVHGEHSRQGIPVGGVAGMANVHRTGGVG